MRPACHVGATLKRVTEPTAGEAVDARTRAADIGDVRTAHARLVGHLHDLDPVDPTRPSRLPDWTIGHVLTHIARNADSVLSMLAGRPQYPHGRAGRNADIEAGAGRSWADLLDDVERTATAVDDALAARDDWTGTVDTIGGSRPTSMVPFLRLREVSIHHTDLGLGVDMGDLPARYVRTELRLMEMLWRANKPMGLTPLPGAALALPPSTRLAWLMGRVEVDGLPPAAIF